MRSDFGVNEELAGEVDDYLFTYRALKSYRGLLRKDIKQARAYKVNKSTYKYEKKVGFISDAILLISKYVKNVGVSETELNILKGDDFLISAQVIHDKMQLEMNKMFDRGELPEMYSGWEYEYGYWGSVDTSKSHVDIVEKIVHVFSKGVINESNYLCRN